MATGALQPQSDHERKRGIETAVFELTVETDTAVRAAAIARLKANRDPAAIQPLMELLRQGAILTSHVGHAVGEVLREYQDPKLVDAVVELLSDPKAGERAAQALGKMGDTRAVHALRPLLRDQRKGVAAAASEAVGSLADTESTETLIALLSDRHEDVRAAAAKGLGELRDVRAIDGLLLALQDKNFAVKEAAADALDKLGQGSRIWPMIDEAKSIVGAPVEAVGVFERDVRFGLGGMFLELVLGLIFSALLAIPLALMGPFGIVVALGFGFGSAHLFISKKKSKGEGIPIMLALAVGRGTVYGIEWKPDEKGANLLSKFAEWKREQLKASVMRGPYGIIQKLTISYGTQSYDLTPKNDLRSPYCYHKVIRILTGES